MMTWTVPTRLVETVAKSNAALSVVSTDGIVSQRFVVVAKATTAKGNPQHQAVAVFIGKRAQQEAQQYAALGFLARVAKVQATSKRK